MLLASWHPSIIMYSSSKALYDCCNQVYVVCFCNPRLSPRGLGFLRRLAVELPRHACRIHILPVGDPSIQLVIRAFNYSLIALRQISAA